MTVSPTLGVGATRVSTPSGAHPGHPVATLPFTSFYCLSPPFTVVLLLRSLLWCADTTRAMQREPGCCE